MGFFSKTFNYLFVHDKGKRFLLFSLFALLPCAAFAYFYPAGRFIGWFFNYVSVSRQSSWASLWVNIFYIRPLEYLYVAAAIVLTVFLLSGMTTVIIRPLRIGKFTVPKMSTLLGENLFPAIHTTAFIVISVLVTHTLSTFFLYLWTFFPNTLGLILSIVTIFTFTFTAVYTYAAMTLWLPVMSMTGLSGVRALGTALACSRGHVGAFFGGFLVMFSLILVGAVISYFTAFIWWIGFIVTALSYTVVTVFCITHSTLAYFEAESITREDLVRSPYLR